MCVILLEAEGLKRKSETCDESLEPVEPANCGVQGRRPCWKVECEAAQTADRRRKTCRKSTKDETENADGSV